MVGEVNPFARLNFANVKTMKDFDERMDRIFEIIAPLRNAAAFSLFLRRGRKLFAQPVEMIVEINQIVNERLLERFVQKIVAILQQFGVKRIEQLLVHTFGVANQRQLLVDLAGELLQSAR